MNVEKKSDDKLDKNINKVINKAVKASAKETAKEIVQELKLSRMLRPELSYFKRVELMLYNYNTLKEALKTKDEDIKYIKEHGLPEKSGSIVVYQTSGGNITGEERYTMLLEKYEIEKMETLREIKRIENALNKIRDDKYYIIIKLKYLNSKRNWTEEEIAEELDKDQSTIYRNKNRLINKIKVMLFPDSIKEFS